MVLRKKNSPPPLEIMGRRSEMADDDPMTASDLVRESEPMSKAMAAGASLSERARYPLVIRLPRAFAFLLAMVILCVILLAYLAGQARGRASERAIVQELQAQLIEPLRPPVSGYGYGLDGSRGVVRGDGVVVGGGDADLGENRGRVGGEVGGQVGGQVGGGLVIVAPRGSDSRVGGMNYFALMSYAPEHAARLIRFLAEHGVDATAVPGHNAGLVKVVALRAFAPGQTRSPERDAYEQYLRRLGRAWKASNGQKGDDLRLMYLERYNPKQ